MSVLRGDARCRNARAEATEGDNMTLHSSDILVRLNEAQEEAKQIGNELWARGSEWHELANIVYKGSKQLWIAYCTLLGATASDSLPPGPPAAPTP